MKTCAQCQASYPDAVEYCPADGTKLPPGAVIVEQPIVDPLLGATLDGRYLIEALLGQGAMGCVYAGRHVIIDKRVAIKVLREEHARADSTAAQRFLDEARAASKIGHQNIVDITDFGVLADGKTYFVMEYLDGPTLGGVLRQHGSVPPKRAIAVSVQIARGLFAAHEKGVVHRDLKPDNIFILERAGEDQKELVKIVDFGIAKDLSHKKRLTQAGMVLGTPEYMSPEQATGQPLDHRVDQYALGCILYEMLTGDVPFRSETPTKTLTQHVFDEAVPPSARRPDLALPLALEAVVMRALQKKPSDRFTDLKEMIGALERVEKELTPAGESRPAELLPAAPSTQAALEAVRARWRGTRIALGVGAAVIFAGLSALVATGGGKPKRTAPLRVAQPAPPKREEARSPQLAPAVEGVEIVLRTTPPGVEVSEGAERLGVAPLRLKRPRSEQPIRLTFRRAGYREETREIAPSTDKDIEVVLQTKEPNLAGGRFTSKSTAHSAPGSRPPPTQPKARVSDLRNPFD